MPSLTLLRFALLKCNFGNGRGPKRLPFATMFYLPFLSHYLSRNVGCDRLPTAMSGDNL